MLSSLLLLAAPTPLAADPASALEAAPAPPLPAEVLKVIEAAMRDGDPAAVETVTRYALQAHPAAAAEIARLVSAFRAERAAQRAAAAPPEPASQARPTLTGSVEVGASRVTGTSSNFGIFAAGSVRRSSRSWSHRLNGRAEIQETDGRRTVERFSAEWQPRRSLGPRVYGFGIAQYDRDPFVGYSNRFSGGAGGGYVVSDDDRLRIELEGGAVWRLTDYRDDARSASLAARASLDLKWKLGPALELKQAGSLVLEDGSGNARATTAVDAALIGPLRLRMSYEVRYDRDRKRQVESTATASRATLVYAF